MASPGAVQNPIRDVSLSGASIISPNKPHGYAPAQHQRVQEHAPMLPRRGLFYPVRPTQKPSHCMGGASSSTATQPPPPAIGSGRRIILNRPLPTVCVRCPTCAAVLAPPAGHPAFRCPCGSVLTYAGAPGASRTASSPGETLLRRAMESLPPSHPQRQFLQQMLASLPRNPDGTLDDTMLAAVLARLGTELNAGASQSLIELLPTHAFHGAHAPAGGGDDRPEESKQCMVCLCEYEEGEVLRTLPCMHFFHKDCVDKWLATRKECPLCKTPIDIGL